MVTIFLWKEKKNKKRLADGYRTFARRKGLRRDKLRLKGCFAQYGYRGNFGLFTLLSRAWRYSRRRRF